MWHPVKTVAETRRFDEEDFVRFAKDNADKFGIVSEYGFPEVGTWYVNDLVSAYRESLKDTEK